MQRPTPYDPTLSAFGDALAGPLGPATLAFALSIAREDIEALRHAGSSWQQITCVLNDHLRTAGRTPAHAATIRGMMARSRTRSRDCHPASFPPRQSAPAAQEQTEVDAESPPSLAVHLSRECERQGFGILSEAASHAALLKDLGD